VSDAFSCVHLSVCRQIELQQEQEAADLCELWNELRGQLLSVFDVAVTQPSVVCPSVDTATADSVPTAAVDSIHELIERFECCM